MGWPVETEASPEGFWEAQLASPEWVVCFPTGWEVPEGCGQVRYWTPREVCMFN